jgi:azurin
MDGCLQRVRFTGGQPVPIAFEARDNGVLLRFDTKVGSMAKEQCFAQCWNYRYSGAYGSPEYSLRFADTPGHDPLEIRSVQMLADDKSLFLEIPQLTPASQVHLHLGTGHDLFITAHALAPAYTDFPGYTAIPKQLPAPAAQAAQPTAAKPNPWQNGQPGRQLIIEAALGLQYVQKELTVTAGERLTLVMKNPDVVPHNWMLGKPGSLKALGDQTNLMIAHPQGLARHYVPDSASVLVYTNMVPPKESTTIHFNAPKEPGDYPYLCTFPGHWMVMNGVMKVR